ncbi:MAG: FtsX-like permease family protein [Elusimicrobiota bacterium]
MSFPFFIARRYLVSQRKQLFTLFTTVIAVGGIALGVASLIVTLSVMNGFHSDLKKKILGTNAHVLITHRFGGQLENYAAVQKKLAVFPEIAATSPFVYSQIILRSGQVSVGAVIKGIIPKEELLVTDLADKLKKGDWQSLAGDEALEPRGIVLGKELAKNLGAGLEDKVILVSPAVISTPFGLLPQMETFYLKGIMETGMYEYDSSLGFISLSTAQKIFNLKKNVTGLEVRLKEFWQAEKFAGQIQDYLGYPYLVRSWMEINRNLFSALKLEKIVMTIILTLIVLVATFNIFSNLMLMTMEKIRDIGILKAMGASSQTIKRIFLWEGLLLGFTGTFIGLSLGWGINFLLSKYQFVKLPADVYYIDTLPVKMLISDFLLVGLIAVIITLIGAWYPAAKAASVEPCEAIRHE